MKVLIIDDEAIIRRALRRVFQSRGHEVFEASGGHSGLEIWKESQPDLVLLDVLMPDLNGPQVLEKMEGTAHSAYVVLMSAFTGDFDSKKARSYGAHEFISKPFGDVFEMVSRMEECI